MSASLLAGAILLFLVTTLLFVLALPATQNALRRQKGGDSNE